MVKIYFCGVANLETFNVNDISISGLTRRKG